MVDQTRAWTSLYIIVLFLSHVLHSFCVLLPFYSLTHTHPSNMRHYRHAIFMFAPLSPPFWSLSLSIYPLRPLSNFSLRLPFLSVFTNDLSSSSALWIRFFLSFGFARAETAIYERLVALCVVASHPVSSRSVPPSFSLSSLPFYLSIYLSVFLSLPRIIHFAFPLSLSSFLSLHTCATIFFFFTFDYSDMSEKTIGIKLHLFDVQNVFVNRY